MKTCSKCGVEKDTTEFSRRGRGLQSHCKACQKAFYQANREKIAERDRARYQANREKRSEQRKAWYQANREKRLEQMKAWQQANPEKRSERTKAYYQANRERWLEYKQRRRALKASAAGSCSTEQWLARLSYFGYTCVYCGAVEDLQIEHQIPLSRGGTNWPANLVPACPSCNLRKGTKTPKEFLDSRQPRSIIVV